MPLVSKPIALACRAERLAWARGCPNTSVITPSSTSQGVRPGADAGEQVDLGELFEVIGGNVLDITFVNIARRDVPGLHQVAQPLRGVRVELVVVGLGLHGMRYSYS